MSKTKAQQAVQKDAERNMPMATTVRMTVEAVEEALRLNGPAIVARLVKEKGKR